ncbi:MAG: glycine betaine/L-proline ABC transporter ATP-binding protein [Cyanobacteria bacterium P01_A01_bin.135]
MPDTHKIRIEHLIKVYGSKPQDALQMFRAGANRDDILEKTGQVLGIADVSLQVAPGEIFVVMGLSGSGKSTLVRCINRLIDPTSGHIYIDDIDVAHADAKQMRQIRLKRVSMVFQRFGLLPHKTVAENVEYGLKVGGVDKRRRREKALDTLETVRLAQWADYLPASLSGGMQQRVGLARALATDAEILLMDEPFSALDPLIRRGMQGELLRLQRELNKTIVFISHDIQEALRIGDRIAVMKDGYVVQVGTPEELVTNPADDYIRAFIQDVNRAQVLKTGTVARQTIPIILGQDSATAAFSQMQQRQLSQMYVLDRQGRPVGILHHTLLEKAMQQGDIEITQVMQTDFPKVNAATSLESVFHMCRMGTPVAVVDDTGKFQGVIESADILASIGRLSAAAEEVNQDAQAS